MVNTRGQNRQESAERSESLSQHEPNPAGQQRDAPAPGAHIRGRMEILQTEPRDSPESPSDVAQWRGSLDEHLRRLDAEPAGAVRAGQRMASERDREHINREYSERREVAFAETPAAPASVHSRASSTTEARKRQAELEAAEKLAELRRRELQIEQELINKRLAVTIDRIEEEGSRAGGSIADHTQKVSRWLEENKNKVSPTRTRGTSPGARRAPSPPAADRTAHSTPRDRSTSRSRGIERLAESLETMMRPPPRQVYELPAFAGDISEWQTFYNAYTQSTQRYKFTYWRTENPDGVEVALVAGKSKVSPLKPLSVPRHELQAALIAARLKTAILEGHRWEPDYVIIWTDSRTVLQWVRTDARRYSAYVSHRLAEIAETTTVNQWRWVPTRENPADEATRADASRQVRLNSTWYMGPDFLRRDPIEWPQEPVLPVPDPADTELKIVQVVHISTKSDFKAPLPNIERFSNYDRLIGATARMLQFIERLKSKSTCELQLQHILAAENLWLQWCQRRDFPEELRKLSRGEPLDQRSKLYEYDPVLSDDGVLRMRGRIDAAPAPINKRPPILCGRNPFVRLLIERAHKRAHDAGNERVINDLKQDYMILRLRPTVRAIAHSCRLCALRRAKPATPPMGNLPLSRIEPYTRPFENCGLDYFGPLTVTIGRRHEKRWVALFTCMTTRAVHLELVHSLSTSSAIQSLRRMAARRGWPRVMWSDNATCFRGADAELRRAYEEWLPELQAYGLTYKMAWRFIPPLSPNMGGCWERLVRSIKNALQITLKSRAPKEETLNTLLAEAEYTVNARPLTHVSTDPREEEALTPNHFLLGGPARVPPTGRCDDADHRAWRASQALADHFWARWVREYLPSLAPRGASAGGGRPLQVNDYVLVVDPNLPRNTWPRGVIERIFTGPDGGIRSADVRTRGVVLRRPTRKLAVLPINPAVADATAGGEMLRTANAPSQANAA